jgi:tyrosine-specific transport protein
VVICNIYSYSAVDVIHFCLRHPQVYHDLIPVVVTLLKGDRRMVRSALLLGSIAPLAMFLGWNLVALAQPHPTGAAAALMERWDPVQQLIEGGSAAAGTAVVCFSLLAIMTSFLGAALGTGPF